MSANIPEVEISAELQQWAEPFFDCNSETYNPLAILERIAALQAQVQTMREAVRDLLFVIEIPESWGPVQSGAFRKAEKRVRAALAATEKGKTNAI